MPLRTIATILAGAALAVGAAAQRPDGGEAPAGPVFLSPMGEPFRGVTGGIAPQARWFAQADLNHDGKLSLDEMRRDGARFFATLDTDHDGEIDPAELDHYENDVAPEIAALLSISGSRSYATESSTDGEPGAKDSNGYPVFKNSGRGGGGRRHRREELPTGYLGLTEPVSSADRNFNRGVSLAEFDTAAQARFHQLDTQNQGYLTPDELKPQLR